MPTGKPWKMFESNVRGLGNVANCLQKSLANAMNNPRKRGDSIPEKSRISYEKVAKRLEKPAKIVLKNPRNSLKNPAIF
jgi:hypothetical protein